MWHYLTNLSLGDFCEILTFIGFIIFLFRRFVLKKMPVPTGAHGKISREEIDKSLTLLKKKFPYARPVYRIPEDLKKRLSANLTDPDLLKELLCDITKYMGIDGSYIKLVLTDDETKAYAGNIHTNGAFTTLSLQVHSYYNLDVLTAVLAHEVMHLFLFYNGVSKRDALENEVLTDTAAVYFGFGEYLKKGYRVIETSLGFSYHKVGYIRTEDVEYILKQI